MNFLELFVLFLLFCLKKSFRDAVKQFIVTLIGEILLRKSSSIHIYKVIRNPSILFYQVEEHSVFQKSFQKMNDTIWPIFALTILLLTIFVYHEPIQIPICVFLVSITFLMHQWCAFMIGGQNQTVFVETTKA